MTRSWPTWTIFMSSQRREERQTSTGSWRDPFATGLHLGKLSAWSAEGGAPPPGLADISPSAWRGDLPPHENGIVLFPFHQRWLLLQRIASDEGVRIARAYDQTTWQAAVQKLAGGQPPVPGEFERLDSVALTTVKRCSEAESAQRARDRERPTRDGKQGEERRWKSASQPQRQREWDSGYYNQAQKKARWGKK